MANNANAEKNPQRTLHEIAERTRRMRREFPETAFSTSAANTARERERLAVERRQ